MSEKATTTVSVPAPNFDEVLSRFTDELGFRLERIGPADDPRHAVVSLGDMVVEIERDRAAPPLHRPIVLPELVPSLEIALAGDQDWVTGRAGMRYRDLIPSRLGGRFIASNIEVCDGGPVPDLVHHHGIRFQLIFCEHGWVDVVYEDQGPPFRMEAGDAVLQPPHIRHRVLASSAGARVVEIGCPAEHDTLVDHELALPTPTHSPGRDFGGQRFVRHQGARVPWHDRPHGVTEQVTEIADATDGLADVRVLRIATNGSLAAPIQHHELDFGFVLRGSATLHVDDVSFDLSAGCSFSLLPGSTWRLEPPSGPVELLRVTVGSTGKGIAEESSKSAESR